MAKTKENDWSVFLAGLGYDKSDSDDKAVFDAFNKKKTTPGELAGLWTDLGVNEVKNMLSKWGIDGDDLVKILSGIKELVPKDKTVLLNPDSHLHSVSMRLANMSELLMKEIATKFNLSDQQVTIVKDSINNDITQ